jgi:hypothetical protein
MTVEAQLSRKARRRLNAHLIRQGAVLLPHEGTGANRLARSADAAAFDRQLEQHLRNTEQHEERIAETWDEMRREVNAIWDASRHLYEQRDDR